MLKLRSRSKSGSGEAMQPPGLYDVPPVPAMPDAYAPRQAPQSPARGESALLPGIALRPDPAPIVRQPSPVFVPLLPAPQDTPDKRTQHLEMLSRPLHRSALGLSIVRCLTLPWVTAPSGLAVCETPDDPTWDVEAIAEAINLLTCGAQAYSAPYARLIGVKNVGQLNTMLSRSGLTTIAPKGTPDPWFPLMTRQPPDFLLQGFGQAHRSAMPSITSTIQSSSSGSQPPLSPPLSKPPSINVAPDKPTRTMEQLMQQLQVSPQGSKQAQDIAKALIMAERERYKTTGVSLKPGTFSQRMSGAMEAIGQAAIHEDPFEFDAHGHGRHDAAAPTTPDRNVSLPRATSPRI